MATPPANEDADGDGIAFHYPLRYPGQTYDRETGLHYNYYRDYNPQTGRYVQSDPIGLAGGINTYAYVESDPLRWVDPEGLAATTINNGGGGLNFPWGCAVGAGVAGGVAGMGGGDGADSGSGDDGGRGKKDKRCKLYTQNRIGLAEGKIRCTYLCKADTGGKTFVTRIQSGASCATETDWVEGVTCPDSSDHLFLENGLGFSGLAAY